MKEEESNPSQFTGCLRLFILLILIFIPLYYIFFGAEPEDLKPIFEFFSEPTPLNRPVFSWSTTFSHADLLYTISILSLVLIWDCVRTNSYLRSFIRFLHSFSIINHSDKTELLLIFLEILFNVSLLFKYGPRPSVIIAFILLLVLWLRLNKIWEEEYRRKKIRKANLQDKLND